MQKMPPELRFVEPMECKEVAQLPEGEDWHYELKLDGYRAIAVKQHGEVNLYSRNGKSFNEKFVNVVSALAKLREKTFVLDGELVALDEQGKHSFSLLQNIKTSRAPVHFYLFDLLHVDGKDLMKLPLNKRRAKLETLFSNLPDLLHLSPILDAPLDVVMQQVKALEFEGLAAKKRYSFYEAGKESGSY
jgi:bifunctional non-homologous end joining protein LigD